MRSKSSVSANGRKNACEIRPPTSRPSWPREDRRRLALDDPGDVAAGDRVLALAEREAVDDDLGRGDEPAAARALVALGPVDGDARRAQPRLGREQAAADQAGVDQEQRRREVAELPAGEDQVRLGEPERDAGAVRRVAVAAQRERAAGVVDRGEEVHQEARAEDAAEVEAEVVCGSGRGRACGRARRGPRARRPRTASTLPRPVRARLRPPYSPVSEETISAPAAVAKRVSSTSSAPPVSTRNSAGGVPLTDSSTDGQRVGGDELEARLGRAVDAVGRACRRTRRAGGRGRRGRAAGRAGSGPAARANSRAASGKRSAR